MHLAGQGVKNISPGNFGGEIDCGEFSIAFVNAWHSSSATVDGELRYMGNPAGFVVRTKTGPLAPAHGRHRHPRATWR